MYFECLDCDRTFPTSKGLQSHSRAKGHSVSECEECERIFVNEDSLMNHLDNALTHRKCSDCNKTFGSRSAYEQHLRNSPAHNYEDTSSESEYASDDSDDDTFCYRCNRYFVDLTALNQHLAFNPNHNWCFICSRDFSSPQALAQHNSSPAHKDQTYKCPFCNNYFKAPSAIAMHIESGCHKITRHQVTRAIHGFRIIPQISVDRRIGGATQPDRLITYSAGERSFNGHGYQCYLCSNTFKTLDRLNQHLNSPAHDDAEFRCPQCKSEFALISGLVQHIESESCGIARFKEVTRQFENLTSQFQKMLTL